MKFANALQTHLERCRGLTVLARRGDTFRRARFVKVRTDGQVGVLFDGDKEKTINYFMEPENTNHVCIKTKLYKLICSVLKSRCFKHFGFYFDRFIVLLL